MPPHALGARDHVVVVYRIETTRWAVVVDGRTLSTRFASEPEANAAAVDERVRLDALDGALLRRARRALRRKQ